MLRNVVSLGPKCDGPSPSWKLEVTRSTTLPALMALWTSQVIHRDWGLHLWGYEQEDCSFLLKWENTTGK